MHVSFRRKFALMLFFGKMLSITNCLGLWEIHEKIPLNKKKFSSVKVFFNKLRRRKKMQAFAGYNLSNLYKMHPHILIDEQT